MNSTWYMPVCGTAAQTMLQKSSSICFWLDIRHQAEEEEAVGAAGWQGLAEVSLLVLRLTAELEADYMLGMGHSLHAWLGCCQRLDTQLALLQQIPNKLAMTISTIVNDTLTLIDILHGFGPCRLVRGAKVLEKHKGVFMSLRSAHMPGLHMRAVQAVLLTRPG